MRDGEPSIEDRVKLRAYAIWEQDGRPDGRSDDHWRRARLDVEAEDAETGASAAPRASPKAKGRAQPGTPSDPHPGMMGDGTQEQNLNQEGDPSARITEAEVDAAFKSAGGEEPTA